MPTISGVVLDAANNPVKTVVDVYRRSTGAHVARGVSSASTGAYAITVPDTGPFSVVKYTAPVIDGNPNWSSCSLALEMVGAANSTTFIDACGATVTPHGDVKIGSDGTYATFDGTGDYLTLVSDAKFQFGTGDFTIRGKAYVTSLNGGYSDYAGTVIDTRNSGTGSGILFLLSSAAKLRVFNLLESTSTISLNTWFDFEVNRSSGVLRLFIDGVLDASVSNSTDLSGNGCVIGAPVDGQANDTYLKFQGRMKHLQVFKGVAIHTATFTPPTTFSTIDMPGTPTEDAQVHDNITAV